jgi:parallel beta-helix repeat protein
MRYVILIIAICALIVGVLFLLGPADAKTIVVDDDWAGADYDNIHDAIRAAKDGDTIRVHDGTYPEVNPINVAIKLVGNGTGTVIDGTKKDHVNGFTLLADGCTVSGFNFSNWNPTHHYAGLSISSSRNTVSGNTFHNNLQGIYIASGTDNKIIGNTFDGNQYGILCPNGADGTNISFNRFTRNTSYGILYGNSKEVEVFSNTFEDYTAGGMSMYRSSGFTVSFNMFDTLSSGGYTRGVYAYMTASSSIHNNTFIGQDKAILATGTTELLVEHNTVSGGVEGMWFDRAYEGPTKTGPYCNGTLVRHNNIVGQSGFGINATGNQVASIDARYNWWGAPSGPYHPSANQKGAGVEVTDLVAFERWVSGIITDMPPVAFILGIEPTLPNEGDTVTFTGLGLARNRTSLHVWTSSIDGEIYSGTDPGFTRDDLSPGTHVIGLKVRDDGGHWSERASWVLNINGVPTVSIKSISPAVVNEGELVTFSGEAWDLEGNVVRVVWGSDIDGVIGTLLEFGTTQLSNGTHTITLTVMDGNGAWSTTATGEVIVNGVPRAQIEPIERTLVNEGEPVIFRGLYEDHEDGVVAYWWESDIDGVLSIQPMFHTSSLSNGTHTITFRVMDDFMVWSKNATATLTVNGLPMAAIVSITPRPAIDGERVYFDGSWTDHEGQISYNEWVSDIDGPLSSKEDFDTMLLSRGVHTITYRVADGYDVWSDYAVTTLTVNGRPKAWIGPVQVERVNEGGTIHLEGGFSDPEDDIRGYEWVSDIDGVVGTAWDLTTSTLSNGTHAISFSVMDGMGTWSLPATVTVTVNGIPRCHILGIEPERVLEGGAVQLSGTWFDHEDDVIAVKWTSDLDGTLGEGPVLSVSDLSNGTHVITLRVMDGQGVWSEPASGSLKVNGRPRAWIESVEPGQTLEGKTVIFSGAASDDLGVVAYLWTSSIDGDLSEQAVFSTAGLSPGEHTITFTAQDNEGVWSEPTNTVLVVEAITTGVDLTVNELPEEAVEGTLITLGCTLTNPGNVPLGGLTVRFIMNDAEVATVQLDRPLSPGIGRELEAPWTAQVGQHALLVQVLRGDQLLTSRISDGTVMVTPYEGPDDPDEPPEGPGTTDDDGTGMDRTVLTVLVVALVVTIAVLNVEWLRTRFQR